MKPKTLLTRTLFGIFLTFSGTGIFAQDVNSSQALIIPDDPILAMLDSLDVVNFKNFRNFTADRNQLNIYKYPADSVPLFDDHTYASRLQKLDNLSPFDFEYNADVKRYIELYAVKRRGTVSRMLALAELYFPLFEEKLAKHKMPLELKYLAIVESALNPNARSKAGATGLWQFMFGTAKMWGLNINSYIDERSDPEKATEAACKYLKHLYKYYGNDWSLALAAYNAGPGNINKAMRRAGGGKKTYWELRPYMPKETAGYVPAFIAVNYIMAYHKEHNLYPVSPNYFYYEIDSMRVTSEVSFSTVASFLNISREELKFLNPAFLLETIPASDEGYAIYLPKNLIGDYIANEKNILNYKPADTMLLATNTTNPVNNNATSTEGKKYIEHTVESGDYLVSVARRYKVRTSDLMAWNSLTSEELKTGQVLKIYAEEGSTPVAVENNTSQNSSHHQVADNTAKKFHTIQRGDTLWNISQRYNVSMDDLKKWNNIGNANSIYVGQKLVIKS